MRRIELAFVIQRIVWELSAVGGFLVKVRFAPLPIHMRLHILEEVSIARATIGYIWLIVVKEYVSRIRMIGALASEASFVHSAFSI